MMQWLEISRSALQNNSQVLKQKAGEKLVWPCIKGNAYGHGLIPIVQASEEFVDGYCVVSTEEALQVRQHTKKPILVLNLVNPDQIADCTQSNIHLPLATAQHKEWYSQQNQPVHVHLELDTGMARTGFHWSSPQEMIEFRNSLPPNIQVVGIYSHYSSAGEDDDFTSQQYQEFEKYLNAYHSHFSLPQYVHIDKSASLLEPQYRALNQLLTLSRPGIAFYGYDADGKTQPDSELQSILSWKTKIIDLRQLKKGDAVGYGLSYRATQSTTIATLPIGYADGFPRPLSNKGFVLVNGERCPIRGRVCMNMTMIEVPPQTKIDDEVILIGQQGSDRITANDLATWSGTTHYEILSRISSLLPRKIID